MVVERESLKNDILLLDFVCRVDIRILLLSAIFIRGKLSSEHLSSLFSCFNTVPALESGSTSRRPASAY